MRARTGSDKGPLPSLRDPNYINWSKAAPPFDGDNAMSDKVAEAKNALQEFCLYKASVCRHELERRGGIRNIAEHRVRRQHEVQNRVSSSEWKSYHHRRIGDASAELSGVLHGVPGHQDVAVYSLGSDVYESNITHPLDGDRRKEYIRPAIGIGAPPDCARIYRGRESMYIGRDDLDYYKDKFGGLTDECLEHLWYHRESLGRPEIEVDETELLDDRSRGILSAA